MRRSHYYHYHDEERASVHNSRVAALVLITPSKFSRRARAVGVWVRTERAGGGIRGGGAGGRIDQRAPAEPQ